MGTKTFSEYESTNVALTTTDEVVVATLSGVSTPRRTTIMLKGWCQVTTGTATTAVTPRIRRGSTVAGTLVGEATAIEVGAAAGSDEEFEVHAEDPGIDMANGTYVLTLQQTSASANGTCLQASLEATCPD